nr:hypothetical protein [Fredinandcohnia sp. SECRCQ15]
MGASLFIFFCFLIWLYFAIYKSSINHWWTVNEIKQTTEDTVEIGVSFVKVIVGALAFTLSGFIICFFITRKK